MTRASPLEAAAQSASSSDAIQVDRRLSDSNAAWVGKVVDGLEVVDQVKQGDKIKSVKIEGDADAALAAKADRVKEWNAILAA